MAASPPGYESTPDAQVAVLGGGIAGCLVACGLADLGYDVVVVEQGARLMDGASRWNDGKIHLGYTYTGTDSLSTARLMQCGAALFFPALERTLGRQVPDSWFGKPIVYVVDGTSLFGVETLWQRAQAVAGLLTESVVGLPGLSRFVPASGVTLERLGRDEATLLTGQRNITGGWQTTEIHVSAREVAAHLRRAIIERAIPTSRAHVVSVRQDSRAWRTYFDDGGSLSSSTVVNCLWEGRSLIDRDITPPAPGEPPVSIRYKRCLFGRATGLEGLTSSTRILGRFGDIATYGNGDAYMSWYPAALAGRSENGVPPPVTSEQPDALVAATLTGLGLSPAMLSRGSWQVAGGYVVAPGSGDIDDPSSMLHTRDRAGARELRPGFVSVDTGKYTTGPMLASQAVHLVARRLGRPDTADSRRLAASA